jgi:hypothetical protein
VKYEYAGGVLPHERLTIEHFEDQVVPYLLKNGGRIGERAMYGDSDCEEVIRRYRQFVQGDPGYRETCFSHLARALKRVELTLVN